MNGSIKVKLNLHAKLSTGKVCQLHSITPSVPFYGLKGLALTQGTKRQDVKKRKAIKSTPTQYKVNFRNCGLPRLFMRESVNMTQHSTKRLQSSLILNNSAGPLIFQQKKTKLSEQAIYARKTHTQQVFLLRFP